MKDPTLRITRSALIKILKDVDFKRNVLSIADDIFNKAQPYQIRDRYNIQVNTKVGKKLQRTVEAETPIIEKFNLILYTIRQELKHQRIKVIHKNDKDYLMLKEVAKMAYEFVEDFNITPREDGYKEYCRIGIGFMGKAYGLNKFKTYNKAIYEYLESYLVVSKDDNVEATTEFYAIWQRIMLDSTGLERQIYLENDYKKYANMVFGRQAADAAGVAYAEWIQAQFDGLAFMNAVPELSQLHGENALVRYERYCRANLNLKKDEDREHETPPVDEELKDYFKKLG